MPTSLSPSQTSHCGHGYTIKDSGDIGRLFRQYGEKYIRSYRPNAWKIRLIKDIRKCRTVAMGGRRIECKSCNHQTYIFYSCGNSQCPICQGIKRLKWQDEMAAKLLKVPYVHSTFTLPHELNGLARNNQKAIYSLLMKTVWKVVKKLFANPKNVGGLPGMTSVLHTFGSDLKYHIHAHCLISFRCFRL